MNDFVRSDDAPCAMVIGLPGIGKSTLAAKEFASQTNQRSALWYKVHEWDSVQSVARTLISFFINSGEDRRFPDLDLEIEVSEIYSPLVLSLRDIKPVIFLDDVDRASPTVTRFIGLLCDAVGSAPPSKIVLVSRSVPQFLSSDTVKVKRLELKCLDKQASSRLASKWDAHDPETVAEESGGHPLMLRLACEAGTEAARGSIDDILGEHFQRVLTPPEKDMLEFLSVVRLPIPARELPGFLPETMASLKRKGLVQEFAEGVGVHQVVRAYFSSRMPLEEALRMHRTAVEYCQGRTGERWRLEEISQQISAGEWARATKVLADNVEGLASGFSEETLALISEIPAGRLEPSSLARLSYVKGRMHGSLAMPRDALGDFEISLASMGEEPDEAMKAKVQESYALTLAEANLITESLETHHKALAYYEGTNDQAGQIREWMGIGSAWRRAHDLTEASDAFGKALRMAREQNNRAAVAANLNNMALIAWESGDLRKAESELRESITEAGSASDPVGEGIGQTNLADLYMVQLREKESENLRLESAETFRRAGDVIQYKSIKARWALEVSRSGRSEEAARALEGLIGTYGRALRPGRGLRSVNIDDGDLVLLMALIEVHRDSGDRQESARSVETLKQLAKDLGRKELEAQADMEAALSEESFGDLDAALGHLKHAEGILREQGNSEGLGAVYLRNGMIRMEMGEREEALVELRESARHAERSGNVFAYAAALDELGEALGSVSQEGREYLERSRQLRKAGRMKAPDTA